MNWTLGAKLPCLVPNAFAAHQRVWLCQLALALTQTAFVLGSVYLKASLESVNVKKDGNFSPIVFAFAREVSAGPMLYALSFYTTGTAKPAKPDTWRVVGLGCCLFCSQLFYILGIELSGVVVATCIQPTIPVFTVLLGIMLQMESAHFRKLAGIGLAVIGAVSMVFGGATAHKGIATAADNSKMLFGNVFLLINTLAMAIYYVLAKSLVSKYTPLQISAWAYIVGAALMGCTAFVFTPAHDWHIPNVMLLPLAYWIFICSIGGYYIVNWAMRHLPASQVAAFQCLQPFLGAVLAFSLLHEQLNWWDLGAFGVVLGLLMISTDTRDVQFSDVIVKLRGMVSGNTKKLELQTA